MKLDDYIRERRGREKTFDEGYDDGLALFMLSQAICLARKDSGLTQSALAKRIGLSVWTISKVERRIEHAAPEEVAAVCVALSKWLARYGYKWSEAVSPPRRHGRHAGSLAALELVHA